MVTTKDIYNTLMEYLTEQLPGMSIEGFPNDINEYAPRHQVGSVLVKPLTDRNIYFRNSSPSMFQQTVYDPIATSELRFGILIVDRDVSSFDHIIEISDAIKRLLNNFAVEGFGRFYFEGSDEPTIDLKLGLSYRTMTFSALGIIFVDR